MGRKSVKKRLRSQLAEIKAQLRKRRKRPVNPPRLLSPPV